MDNSNILIIGIVIVIIYIIQNHIGSRNREGYSGKVESPHNVEVPSFEPYWVHLGWAFYDPFRYEQTYVPRYNWLFPDDYHQYNYIY